MISEETKKAFELDEKDCEKMERLMRQGKSLAESLVAIGKATRKVEQIKEPPKTKGKREVKIDPVKDWLITTLTKELESYIGVESLKDIDITCVLRDGTKKIDMTINGESYSLTLTKKRAVK